MTSLKSWREKNDVTQTDFGKRIGVSTPTVSRIETGDQWPSAEIITAIEKETRGEVTAADILATYQSARCEAPPASEGDGATA